VNCGVVETFALIYEKVVADAASRTPAPQADDLLKQAQGDFKAHLVAAFTIFKAKPVGTPERDNYDRLKAVYVASALNEQAEIDRIATAVSKQGAKLFMGEVASRGEALVGTTSGTGAGGVGRT
jgi:hypothetical protein